MGSDEPQVRYLRPEQICEFHPGFTKSWVLLKIRNRRENGLDAAVFKIGKKIFVDEARFINDAVKPRRLRPVI